MELKPDSSPSFNTHTIRFIDRLPQSIQSLSFSDNGSQLALSRGDGNLELWGNSNGVFSKKLNIPGKLNNSIETLVWYKNHLITGSLSGLLEEWDFVRLQPRYSENLSAGPIWCLRVSSSGTLVAAGCENGKVFVFQSIGACDDLELMHALGQQSFRIISLAWSYDDKHLVVGSYNGSIKKINVSSGRCEIDISYNKSSSCIIWDLVYLESLIVSADSCGKVQFWSDEHGTLVQSFQEHAADVLAISAGSNKDVIYSTGVDQKVVCLRKLKQNGDWIKQGEVKVHTHDVRAMDLSSGGLLATGGIDTDLVIMKTENLSVDQSAKYSALQDSDQYISIASDAKVVMHQTNSLVKLWQISQSTGDMPVNFLDISSRNTRHILSSAISSDGTKIALSTVKMFWLYDLNNADYKYKCMKCSDFPSYKMAFGSNNSLLIMATIRHGIQVLHIETDHFEEKFSAESMKCYLPITSLCSNGESSHIVITGFNEDCILCDLKSNTFVYKLPLVGSQSLCSFCPGGNELILYSSGRISMYDIALGAFTELGTVHAQGRLSLPKGLCVIDNNTVALYYKEAMALVQLESSKKHLRSTVFKYNGLLLFVAMCSDNNIIVVEQLWNKFVENLPPVLYKDNYGT